MPPLTKYQTSILADFTGKGLRKIGPVPATEFRLFSSKSQRVIEGSKFLSSPDLSQFVFN